MTTNASDSDDQQITDIGRVFDDRSSRAFLIAEVAQAHDGSLDIAHSFIDAAADARADAIKFQTHIAAAESTTDEPFRVRFSRRAENRYEYWKRMEFDPDQWAGLAEHSLERGLHFLSSPFSVEAVQLLARLGVTAWKIGSGEVRSPDLLNAMLEAGGPVLLSTGMSPWSDIDDTVTVLRRGGVDFAVLQCTSRYPTSLDEVGLNVLDELARRYDCPVGLSDHSGTPYPALAAMARGAKVVELHVTFDRRMFGPDASASVTFDELASIACARDAFAEMDAHPVDKDAMAESLADLRDTFGKSVAPTRALEAGTVLQQDMLTLKKPGSGIPPDALSDLVGRRLLRDLDPARLLQWEDVDVEA